MLTVHLDTSKLSDHELANVTRALRGPCAECIEGDIPGAGRNATEVAHFLDALATAIERELHTRSGRDPRISHEADATGVP